MYNSNQGCGIIFVICGGNWNNTTNAGVWYRNNNNRTNNNNNAGFRAGLNARISFLKME